MDRSRPIYEQIFKKYWDKTLPFSVTIELTYRCNLGCVHCYVENNLKEQELTTLEVKQLLNKLAQEKVIFLTFTGGEIFLREDLFEIASYARKNGFMIKLFTNGTLITPTIADMIKGVCPEAVEISMYGATAQTHEDITKVSGSFEKSINAFKLLKERGITTIFKPTLMRQNFAEYSEMKSLAEKLKAVPRFSITITARNDGGTTPYQYRLSNDQLATFFQQFTYDEEEDIEEICKQIRGSSKF
ncbi:MAG: radical SAM protein [bacterium]